MEPTLPSYWDPTNGGDEITVSMTALGRSRLSAASSSSRPAKPPKILPIPTHFPDIPPRASELPPLELKPGEMIESVSNFIPLLSVGNFAATYVDEVDKIMVADYFNSLLFEYTPWDIFFMIDPRGERKPLLLVTTWQLERYLDLVSIQYGTSITTADEKWRQDICIAFGKWGTPRPRFLVRAGSFRDLDKCMPFVGRFPADNLDYLTPICSQMYRDRMDMIYSVAGSPEQGGALRPSVKKRLVRATEGHNMFKRVHEVLGERRTGIKISSEGSPISTFQEYVRLVSVDIEAYEKDSNAITEIGLAVLDTKKITGSSPGWKNLNWYTPMQTYHLRISEYCHLVNSQFIEGRPEAFNFGKSIMVSIMDVNKYLNEIIDAVSSNYQGTVILIGHDVAQDIKYLKRLGYRRLSSDETVELIDTQLLFQYLVPDLNRHSLADVCTALGINGHNYHNAGNDAVYTMRAMLAMAADHKNISALELDLFHSAYNVFHPDKLADNKNDEEYEKDGKGKGIEYLTVTTPPVDGHARGGQAGNDPETSTPTGKPMGKPIGGSEDDESEDDDYVVV